MTMLQEEADVTKAEATASESSPENQTPEPQEEQEEAKIPKSRLDKEVARRKAAEELLASYQLKKTESSEAKAEVHDFRSAEDWAKFIKKESQEAAKAAAQEAEARARLSLKRDLEVNELEKEDDFHVFAPAIKAEIERNPTLSPREAYYLAKAKNPILSRKEEEAMEKKIRAEAEAKQKAQVGSSGTRQTPKAIDRAAIFEKDAKGKYKYSLAEIEAMLRGK